MSAEANPRSPQPDVVPWKAWQGWATLIIGAYLLLAPLWTSAAPGGWFITLGIATGLVALWQLGSSLSVGSNWTQIVIGAITFLAPWFGGFTDASGASWTLWILAVAVIIISAVALGSARRNG